MVPQVTSSKAMRVGGYVLVTIVLVAVIVLLLMWLMGTFHAKIGQAPAGAVQARPVGEAELVAVRSIRLPVNESAVGSVRPVHETSVASKILAKVVAVNMKAGQPVRKDDVLVQLDDADLKARRDQASAAVNAARAARDQAKNEYDRVKRLFDQQSAAQIEMDRATTTLKSTEAELQRAEEALREAQTILEYATIKSPLTGTVVDRKVDVGDMVTPGRVLATLYDPTHMQLVASVRESLTRRLRVGQGIMVKVDVLDHPCEGQVSEIVPESESASRTFSVKVTGPCPAGIYTGMFGRLIIPLDEEDILVVPAAAIRRVGQLTVVDVAEEQALRRRAVQVGRYIGQDVEILSGLREGERVALIAPGGRNSGRT